MASALEKFEAAVAAAITEYEVETGEQMRVAQVPKGVGFTSGAQFREIYSEPKRKYAYTVTVGIKPNFHRILTSADESKYAALNGNFECLAALMLAAFQFPDLEIDLPSSTINYMLGKGNMIPIAKIERQFK